MCVEKNERSTDSRVKAGIQNIFGGMVLVSLPVVAIAVIGMWGSISRHSIQLKYQGEDHASMLQRIMLLEQFKSKTESDRFRRSDGARLELKVDRVSEEQQYHDTKAQGWITTIKRNTSIIMENQRKAHMHIGIPSNGQR